MAMCLLSEGTVHDPLTRQAVAAVGGLELVHLCASWPATQRNTHMQTCAGSHIASELQAPPASALRPD